jgi:multidrug efflux pump subunit AcrA (membrane-fusion protein)
LPPVLSSAAPDGVETWAELVRQQQATIQAQQKTIQAQQETIEALERQLRQQQERIEQLEADLRAQKKLKGKPKIGASRLNEPASAPEGKSEKKRPGSAKRSKKLGFEIHEERIIPPTDIPATAKFNGYRDYDVQELTLERHNIRFRLARVCPGGWHHAGGPVCLRSIVMAITAPCWSATFSTSIISAECPIR